MIYGSENEDYIAKGLHDCHTRKKGSHVINIFLIEYCNVMNLIFIVHNNKKCVHQWFMCTYIFVIIIINLI